MKLDARKDCYPDAMEPHLILNENLIGKHKRNEQMKTFLSVLFLALTFTVSAQYKKPIVAQIKTPQAQCAECKERIEKFMKTEEGVVKVVVDIRKKNNHRHLCTRPYQYRKRKNSHCQPRF